MAQQGFERVGRGEFSNGRACVRFEGTQLIAIPGDCSRQWRSDISEATPDSVVALLEVVLATPQFLAQPEIDRRAERTRVATAALDGIAESIRTNPEERSGRALSQILWSLFNGHHLVNLWSLTHALDRTQMGWATEIFAACMDGTVTEEHVRQTLLDSGEMDRSCEGNLNPTRPRRSTP